MTDFWDIFLEVIKAVPGTLALALPILLISFVLGIILAVIFVKRIKVIVWLAHIYISIFRGTPLLVQLFICYYTLPGWIQDFLSMFHIEWDKNNLNPFVIIIVSFSFYFAAYQQETVRAAFLSVDVCQRELSKSLGYTYMQSLLRVILPQAMRYAMPNILNTFLSIMKALSVAFTISVADIFAKAKILASINGKYMLTFAAAALTYWLISVAFTRIFAKLEERLYIE